LWGKNTKKFVSKKKLANPYKYWAHEHYLPQHCLYFLPLPHGFWYLGFWELLGALGSLIRRLVALGSTP
jgi:hypothetical protein